MKILTLKNTRNPEHRGRAFVPQLQCEDAGTPGEKWRDLEIWENVDKRATSAFLQTMIVQLVRVSEDD